MCPCNDWPYTNVHQLNLDWVICKIKYTLTELDSLKTQVGENSDKIANLQHQLDILVNQTLPGLIDPAVAEEINRLIENGTLGELINTSLWDEIKKEFESIIAFLQSQQQSNFAPYYHCFGGQLASMIEGITYPNMQYVGIVLCGDSITWGVGSTGAASTTGNTHQQNSTRNNAQSPSWANLFRQWVKDEFFPQGTVTLSNNKYAPSGQSVTTITQPISLLPWTTPLMRVGVNKDGVVTEYTGTEIIVSASRVAGTESVTTLQHAQGVTTYPFIQLQNFTGNTLSISYNLNPAEDAAAVVQLYVNGEFIKEIDTYSAAGGYGLTSTFAFNFVRNGTVELRIADADRGNQLYTLRCAGVIIPKTVEIKNNAISGIDWLNYFEWNISRPVAGVPLDAVAIHPEDSFALIMLGTNDRGKGFNNRILYPMEKFLEFPKIAQCKLTILTPPNNPETTIPNGPNLSDIRDLIINMGASHHVDVIDQFAAISNYLAESYTVSKDALHPNDFGHAILFSNVKQAILAAHLSN